MKATLFWGNPNIGGHIGVFFEASKLLTVDAEDHHVTGDTQAG